MTASGIGQRLSIRDPDSRPRPPGSTTGTCPEPPTGTAPTHSSMKLPIARPSWAPPPRARSASTSPVSPTPRPAATGRSARSARTPSPPCPARTPRPGWRPGRSSADLPPVPPRPPRPAAASPDWSPPPWRPGPGPSRPETATPSTRSATRYPRWTSQRSLGIHSLVEVQAMAGTRTACRVGVLQPLCIPHPSSRGPGSGPAHALPRPDSQRPFAVTDRSQAGLEPVPGPSKQRAHSAAERRSPAHRRGPVRAAPPPRLPLRFAVADDSVTGVVARVDGSGGTMHGFTRWPNPSIYGARPAGGLSRWIWRHRAAAALRLPRRRGLGGRVRVRSRSSSVCGPAARASGSGHSCSTVVMLKSMIPA